MIMKIVVADAWRRRLFGCMAGKYAADVGEQQGEVWRLRLRGDGFERVVRTLPPVIACQSRDGE